MATDLLGTVPAYLPPDPENDDVHLDTSGYLPVERLATDDEFDSPTPDVAEPSIVAVLPGDERPHWTPISAIAHLHSIADVEGLAEALANIFLPVVHVPLTTAQGELVVLEDGGAIVATIPLNA